MRISKNRIKTLRPLAADPHFNNVTLLLTMDGANGSTTFVDRSLNANTLTPNGWSLTTSNFKYGWSSAQSPISPTSSNGIQITPTTALQMGASDFTFEAWVNVRTVGNPAFWYFNVFTGVNDEISAKVVDSTRIAWAVGSYTSGAFSYSFPINIWTHVALTRSGSSIRFFINGSQVGTTGTYSGTLPTQDRMWLGRIDRYGSTAQPMDGFIDDFRITKGVARYTSNFTPPSSFLQTNAPNYKISSRQEADPFYENVSLLLKMDGANGSTTFTDSSPTPKTVTRNGSVIISNARINPRIGVTSAYFDGDGDFLSVSNNSDFSFGTSDCTIECWIYIVSTPPLGNGAALFTNWDGTSGITLKLAYADFGGGPSMRIMADRGGNAFGPSIAISLNTWYHVAFIKTSSGAKVFVNGVGTTFETPYNHNLTSAATNIQIGKFITPAITQLFNGYIDDLRVTKGVARYTSNFTVPNESFPDFGVRTFRMPLAQSTTFSMNDLSGVDFNTTATTQLTSFVSMNELSQVDFNTIAITNVALTMTG